MKIGIFHDIHANLPALKKAIEFFRSQQCEKIYHVGDLIGIGPYPREVVELSFSITEMNFIMGNHDYWYAFGIPKPRPKLMNEEEEQHQNWTHQQIGKNYKSRMQRWKFIEKLNLPNDKSITFQHYGYDERTNWFKAHIKYPTTSDLDKMYDNDDSDMIFYGHNHLESDIQGRCRYVNLGSAGCFSKPEIRLGILEISNQNMKLSKFSIPYDDNGLMEAFETRQVPARKFITKVFITRD